jgi:hypothetical protein
MMKLIQSIRMSKDEEIWFARQHATGVLVRACFDSLAPRNRTAKTLHALARITWINHSPNGGVADNTRNVVAPALVDILGIELSAVNIESLVAELREARVLKSIRDAAAKEVGFTDYYAAFRNTSQHWMDEHVRLVRPILRAARTVKSDTEARRLYRRIGALPPIPRNKSGPSPAANLLTPIVACLDPRSRSPIINRAKGLVRTLEGMGLKKSSLVEQFDGLVGLIGQAGIKDAFFIDTCRNRIGGLSVERRPSGSREKKQAAKEHNTRIRGTGSAPLKNLDIEEVKVIYRARTASQIRLHNRMSNRLGFMCKNSGLEVHNGTSLSCRYDALIKEYDRSRDLLIEAKSSPEVPDLRLAVGQLLDYQRQLGTTRWRTDLAVLLPKAPSKQGREFLNSVGVKLLVFTKGLKKIRGDWSLP